MPTKVDVIYTFYDSPQSRQEVQIASLTEKCLLDTVFGGLKTKELQQLLKLSCAFDVGTKAALPAFVKKNNGKFYFNVEANADLQTIGHCQHKLKALQARLKKA